MIVIQCNQGFCPRLFDRSHRVWTLQLVDYACLTGGGRVWLCVQAQYAVTEWCVSVHDVCLFGLLLSAYLDLTHHPDVVTPQRWMRSW